MARAANLLRQVTGGHDLDMNKLEQYRQVRRNIETLTDGEDDEICVLSTVACDLRHAFRHFDWVGFYRVTRPGILKVGPYQGGHGCLTIPFNRGVCGKCASTKEVQLVRDVRQLEYHIACSSSTLSEIVLPVLDGQGEVRAVLDIDSNTLDAFDDSDSTELGRICSLLRRLYR